MSAVALVVGVGAVCLTGCKMFKKKAGDKCTGDQALCLDKETILTCENGVFAQMSCKGAMGCGEKVTGVHRSGRRTTTNYAVSCDFSGNEAASPCTADDDSAMCSADKKTMVMCSKGKIERHSCLGKKQCAETKDAVNCDTSVQNVGDECEGTAVACSPDGKQRLECRDGKMGVELNCRGPKACSVNGQNKIECDRGGQAIGDPCGDDGDYACTADEKAIVKCASHKWAMDEPCGTKKKKCTVVGNQVGCK